MPGLSQVPFQLTAFPFMGHTFFFPCIAHNLCGKLENFNNIRGQLWKPDTPSSPGLIVVALTDPVKPVFFVVWPQKSLLS